MELIKMAKRPGLFKFLPLISSTGICWSDKSTETKSGFANQLGRTRATLFRFLSICSPRIWKPVPLVSAFGSFFFRFFRFFFFLDWLKTRRDWLKPVCWKDWIWNWCMVGNGGAMRPCLFNHHAQLSTNQSHPFFFFFTLAYSWGLGPLG